MLYKACILAQTPSSSSVCTHRGKQDWAVWGALATPDQDFNFEFCMACRASLPCQFFTTIHISNTGPYPLRADVSLESEALATAMPDPLFTKSTQNIAKAHSPKGRADHALLEPLAPPPLAFHLLQHSLALSIGQAADLLIACTPHKLGYMRDTLLCKVTDSPEVLTVYLDCIGELPYVHMRLQGEPPPTPATRAAEDVARVAEAVAAAMQPTKQDGNKSRSSSQGAAGPPNPGTPCSRAGHVVTGIMHVPSAGLGNTSPARAPPSPASKAVDFGRVLLGSPVQKTIVLQNLSLLPLWWELESAMMGQAAALAGNQLASANVVLTPGSNPLSISPSSGHLLAQKEGKLTLQLRPAVEGRKAATLMLSVFSAAQVQPAVQRMLVIVQWDVYKMEVRLAMPGPDPAVLDLGLVCGCNESSQVVTVLNHGKHEVSIKAELGNLATKGLLMVTPVEGRAAPNASLLMTYVFNGGKRLHSGMQLVACPKSCIIVSNPASGQEEGRLPVPISVRAHVASLAVVPEDALDLGPVATDVTSPSQIVMENVGQYPFSFSLVPFGGTDGKVYHLQ